MKKKIGLFFGLLLGLVMVSGIGANRSNVVYAEGESEPGVSEPAPESSEEPITSSEEPVEPVEPAEVYECSVVLGTYEHGKIFVDILEGHAGDMVTLTAKHDLFYLVSYVSVNGVNLVEDEEISGLYKFALVEGENVITAKFVVDAELLGEMSIIYEQAMNKDWTNLFTVENVARIIMFLLDGGLLFAMVRYFIKDKRIANNVERSVKETCNAVLPDMTKKVVVENTQKVLEPVFTEITAYQQEIMRVVGVLIKCIALMQENTPDARRAILTELSNLNIGDMKIIDDARAFIDKYFADKMGELQQMINGLDNVIAKNKEVVDKVGEIAAVESPKEEKIEVKPTEDGTQI